jgi:hypothetical protein
MKAPLSVVAAIALLVIAAIPAVAQERCTDPNVEGEFVCGEVSAQLTDEANIEDVLARSAPGATIDHNVGEMVEKENPDQIEPGDDRYRLWVLNVAHGEEVTTRDALLADEGVEYAGLTFYGELTDGDTGSVPDTAVPPVRAPIGALAGTAALLFVAVSTLIRIGRR